MSYLLKYSGFSTKGIRPKNQDNFLIEIIQDKNCDLEAVLAIADGMGGMANGNIASEIAISKLNEIVYRDVRKSSSNINKDINEFIKSTYSEINKAILKKASESNDYKGMGTTLICAFIFSNTEIYFANVGDSRAYLIYPDELIQTTVDHDVVTDAKLKGIVSSSNINLEMYANALTRSMGANDYSTVDIFGPFALNIGEGLLLSSDGFHKFIQENQVLHIFKRTESKISIAENLVEKALQNGSDDNITVVTASCYDPSQKSILEISDKRKFWNKIGLSLFPLIIITIYVGYLFYKEYNMSINHPQKTIFYSLDSNQKASLDINSFSNSNMQTNKSLRLICTELSIPYPNIPNLKIFLSLDSNLLFINSGNKNLSKWSVQVLKNPNFNIDLFSDSTSFITNISKIKIKNVKDQDSNGEKSCALIQSEVQYSIKEKQHSITVVFVDENCTIDIEAPFVVITKHRDLFELLEIIEAKNNTTIKISNGSTI